MLEPGHGASVARQPQHDLLGDLLDRGGEIHLAPGDAATRAARGGPPKSSPKRSFVIAVVSR